MTWTFWKSPRADKPTAVTSDVDLLAVFNRDPWMLGCAVMADQRSDGMVYGFDLWWSISGKNWLPKAQQYFPSLTMQELESFLRRFVQAHRHQTGSQVMNDAALAAGVAPLCVIGPGETLTLSADIHLTYPAVLFDKVFPK